MYPVLLTQGLKFGAQPAHTHGSDEDGSEAGFLPSHPFSLHRSLESFSFHPSESSETRDVSKVQGSSLTLAPASYSNTQHPDPQRETRVRGGLCVFQIQEELEGRIRIQQSSRTACRCSVGQKGPVPPSCGGQTPFSGGEDKQQKNQPFWYRTPRGIRY